MASIRFSLDQIDPDRFQGWDKDVYLKGNKKKLFAAKKGKKYLLFDPSDRKVTVYCLNIFQRVLRRLFGEHLYRGLTASNYAENLVKVGLLKERGDKKTFKKRTNEAWQRAFPDQFREEILAAVDEGDANRLRFYAQQGISLATVTEPETGNSLLHLALSHPTPDRWVVRTLLAQKCDSEKVNAKGQKPIDLLEENKGKDIDKKTFRADILFPDERIDFYGNDFYAELMSDDPAEAVAAVTSRLQGFITSRDLLNGLSVLLKNETVSSEDKASLVAKAYQRRPKIFLEPSPQLGGKTLLTFLLSSEGAPKEALNKEIENSNSCQFFAKAEEVLALRPELGGITLLGYALSEGHTVLATLVAKEVQKLLDEIMENEIDRDLIIADLISNLPTLTTEQRDTLSQQQRGGTSRDLLVHTLFSHQLLALNDTPAQKALADLTFSLFSERVRRCTWEQQNFSFWENLRGKNRRTPPEKLSLFQQLSLIACSPTLPNEAAEYSAEKAYRLLEHDFHQQVTKKSGIAADFALVGEQALQDDASQRPHLHKLFKGIREGVEYVQPPSRRSLHPNRRPASSRSPRAPYRSNVWIRPASQHPADLVAAGVMNLTLFPVLFPFAILDEALHKP